MQDIDVLRVGEASAILMRRPQTSTHHHLYVGLTGGIGAGKSTIAQAFRESGAEVFAADDLAREVVEPGSDGLAQITSAFGTEVLKRDGSLDRSALARIVFEHPEKRMILENITHPAIARRARELRDRSSAPMVVYDVPLLVEKDLANQFDVVVVVDAPTTLRIDRLRARGMSDEDAHARIVAQATDSERLEVADIWLRNEGTKEDARALIHLVVAKWLDPAVGD